MVFVYTTCRDVNQAKDLGKRIIKARVASCVNIWPIESVYTWEGEVKEDQEAALLIKTNEPKVADLEMFLVKNHTYTTPLVATVNVHRLNREYKEWMSTVIAP
ncbi:MAG: divalent-cation tolerance protein CutA [Candidatus Jorgensenbacteria bacterium]